MLKRNVKMGEKYEAKVSGQRVVVRLTAENRFGGWDAVNEKTGRAVRIKSAARLSPMSAATVTRLRAANPPPPLDDPESPTTTVMAASASLVEQADAMAKVAEVLALDAAIEYEQALDAQARGRV